MRTCLAVTAGLAVGLFLLVGGCGKKEEFQEYDQVKVRPADPHDHEHGHGHGPRGGHLIELGDHEYHAEIVFDKETRKTTLYILGPDAKTAVPIDADELTLHLDVGQDHVHLDLKPAPLEGEPEGKSSRFEAAGEEVPEALDDEEKFEGHFDVEIGGKEYEGEITHRHGGHQHDHDHEKPAKPAGEQ